MQMRGRRARLGDGKQWMPWVHIDDAVGALLHLIDSEAARGAYNLVAPAPVRNADFTAALGRALHRPTLLPVPKFGVKLALGEMGEALLLDGQRALPRRLEAEGFVFRYRQLDAALAEIL